jgi:thiol-disulfide isomerase/thioredoxin
LSADNHRRPSRGALIALVIVSIAVPAAVLAWALHGSSSSKTDPTQQGVLAGTPTRAKVGSVAPDFTLPTLSGSKVTLSHLRGKVVVLTFFASWCHPCEEDMPVLQRLQDRQPEKVTVIGVNYQDFAGDTRDFVNRLHVSFPALVEDSTQNPVAKRYDVHAMPDTVFIDAQGVVRDRLYGQTSAGDLRNAINKLLPAT